MKLNSEIQMQTNASDPIVQSQNVHVVRLCLPRPTLVYLMLIG